MILSANELAYLALQGWGSTIAPDGTPNAQVAVAIAYAESAGDTYAIGQNVDSEKVSSGSQDLGLWQINNFYHRAKLIRTPAWRDPWVSLSLAVQVFQEFERAGKPGWKAWSTYNGGTNADGTPRPASYLRHVAKARVGLLQPWAPPGGSPSDATLLHLMLRAGKPAPLTVDVLK